MVVSFPNVRYFVSQVLFAKTNSSSFLSVSFFFAFSVSFLFFARTRLKRTTSEKSKIAWPRIPMLGVVVGRGTRTVQPGKTQALKDWPNPETIADVCSLRAFGNYLRSFIPDFLEIDRYLKTATKKGNHGRNGVMIQEAGSP